MAENRLNLFVGDPKRVKVCGQSSAECVPAVPLGAKRGNNAAG